MLTLGINDILLVKQVANPIISPWGYKIVDMETATEIVSVTGLTAAYALVSLVSATYAAYIGKALLLEIYNGGGTLLEQDEFLLGSAYNKFTELKKIVGLLGENLKYDASDNTDFDQGHEKHRDVTLYTDATMVTTLEEYDWDNSYVADFTPDHRFHTQKTIQKEA